MIIVLLSCRYIVIMVLPKKKDRKNIEGKE